LCVACCVLQVDGRTEWHQEEPVLQCDFSMGYSGAAMHQQHRPAMSQARRLASDEWFGPHHSRSVSRQTTCHQQSQLSSSRCWRLQSEDFRGRSQRLSYNRCAVQVLSSSDHADQLCGLRWVAYMIQTTVDSTLGHGRTIEMPGALSAMAIPSVLQSGLPRPAHVHAHCHSLGY
jgi:hypothetical protein